MLISDKECYQSFRNYHPTKLIIRERKKLARLIINGAVKREDVQQEIDELSEALDMIKLKFGVKPY